MDKLGHIMAIIRTEYERAAKKHPGKNESRHHGFAVLKEEVDELWDAVKTDNIEEGRTEAVQVAAMAIRFLMETPEQ